MGWRFKWVSSGGSDFNYHYQVSFTPEEMERKQALYNYTVRDPQARARAVLGAAPRRVQHRPFTTLRHTCAESAPSSCSTGCW